MRYAWALFLILATAGLAEAKKKKKEEPAPPPCIEEEGMITHYHGQMTELLGKIKQEDVTQFERNHHRKEVENFLAFWGGAYAETLDCYEKAVQEPTTPKKVAAELKGKGENFGKQAEQVKSWRDSLKNARSLKDAKSVVDGIELPEGDSAT